MTINNNPAGRLKSLLEEGLRKPKNEPIYKIWASLLLVNEDDIPTLLRRLAHVNSLINEIEFQIRTIDDITPEIFLKWTHSVKNALKNLNFSAPWDIFIRKIDREVLYGLEVCSDLLSKKRPEKVINPQLLSELMEEVDILITQIHESTIDDELRNILLEQLLIIKHALEEYKIRGIKGLESALKQFIGSRIIENDKYEKLKKNRN